MIMPGQILDAIMKITDFDIESREYLNPNVNTGAVLEYLGMRQATPRWDVCIKILTDCGAVKVTGEGIKSDPKMLALTFAARAYSLEASKESRFAYYSNLCKKITKVMQDQLAYGMDPDLTAKSLRDYQVKANSHRTPADSQIFAQAWAVHKKEALRPYTVTSKKNGRKYEKYLPIEFKIKFSDIKEPSQKHATVLNDWASRYEGRMVMNLYTSLQRYLGNLGEQQSRQVIQTLADEMMANGTMLDKIYFKEDSTTDV